MVAAVTSLPGVCFFIFHYESGLVLKIVFEKYLFGAPFSPFFSFFNFEHFSQKKWKKNTRTSMVAAVTSLPRVSFLSSFCLENVHISFFFCVCTRALHMCFHSYMCKDLAHSSQFTHPKPCSLCRHTLFLSFASHSLHPPSSFLSCIVWLHGSH